MATIASVPRLSARQTLHCAICCTLAFAIHAHAAPTGGQVVGGTGSIGQSGLDTSIVQESQRLAINWSSFNIASDERVEFIQPGSDALALNRILGNDGSQILGRLEANGHVLLVNPNGIFFGESARVDVGGLVASGLDIKSQDFLNDHLVFKAKGSGAAVVINQGIINAALGGNVALVGKRVANEGFIGAALGSVALAAGREAVLTFDPQGLLGVRVTKETLQQHLGDDAAVDNSGYIKAPAGRVLLTASASQEVFSQAVNSGDLAGETEILLHEDGSFTLGKGADLVNTGRINTRDIGDENPQVQTEGANEPYETTGKVVMLADNITHTGDVETKGYWLARKSGDVLLAATGAANVSGGIINTGTDPHRNGATIDGGAITILGKDITLDDGALITSAARDPGHIRIGGRAGSASSRLGDTATVHVDASATINSETVSFESEGGQIDIWAKRAAEVAGVLDVSSHIDTGGSVSVVSEGTLGFSGSVDLSSGTIRVDGEERDWGTPGSLHLQARNLAVRPTASATTVTEAALNEALSVGHVSLAARNRLTVGASGAGVYLDSSGADSPTLFSLAAGGAVKLIDSFIGIGSGQLRIATGVAELAQGCAITDAPDLRLISSIIAASHIDFDLEGALRLDANSAIIPSQLP